MAQIKKFNDYEATQSYSDIPQLPKGGYVLKILGAEVAENTIGQYIKLSCDIVEGEYKDFFANDYRAQSSEDKKWHCNFLLNVPNDDGSEKDGWTKRRFKTVIEAIEDSNSGYHFDWDSDKFKGKLVGGLFNIREYEKNDGTIGRVTNLAQFCKVSVIKDGSYKLPEDKILNSKPTGKAVTGNEGFMKVPENEDLPF